MNLVLFGFNCNIFVIYALLFIRVIKIISQFILLWNWRELPNLGLSTKLLGVSQWEIWHWVLTGTFLAYFLGQWKSFKLPHCTQCQATSLHLGLQFPMPHFPAQYICCRAWMHNLAMHRPFHSTQPPRHAVLEMGRGTAGWPPACTTHFLHICQTQQLLHKPFSLSNVLHSSCRNNETHGMYDCVPCSPVERPGWSKYPHCSLWKSLCLARFSWKTTGRAQVGGAETVRMKDQRGAVLDWPQPCYTHRQRCGGRRDVGSEIGPGKTGAGEMRHFNFSLIFTTEVHFNWQ